MTRQLLAPVERRQAERSLPPADWVEFKTPTVTSVGVELQWAAKGWRDLPLRQIRAPDAILQGTIAVHPAAAGLRGHYVTGVSTGRS